jgi:hypothetical protein
MFGKTHGFILDLLALSYTSPLTCLSGILFSMGSYTSASLHTQLFSASIVGGQPYLGCHILVLESASSW